MPYTSFVSSGSTVSYPIPGYDTAVSILRNGCQWGLTTSQMAEAEWQPGNPSDEDIRKNITRVGIGSTWTPAEMPSYSEMTTEVAREQAIYDYYAYERNRSANFPSIGIQLDQLYHDIESGKLGAAATTGDWYVGISNIKASFSKPGGSPPT